MMKMASKENARRSSECCMCGDQGLFQELFQCRICNFRSQHRYCSDLYPKASSYEVCNWCLKKKEQEETAQTSSSSISSSSSHDHNTGNINNSDILIDGEEPNYKEKKNGRRNTTGNYSNLGHTHLNLKAHHYLQGTNTTTTTTATTTTTTTTITGAAAATTIASTTNHHHHHHQLNLSKPIKKQRSPDRSFGKKRNIVFSSDEVGKEGNLRMPKFEEIPQSRIPKKVFRSRIPRYKLLEEVCR